MPTINCGAVWHGWTITNLIGSGSYGTVYEVERRMFDDVEKSGLKHISVPHDEGEVRAMKSEGETEESITRTFTTQAKDIFNEYKMLAKLNDCPNVVTCHDVECREKENAYGWDIMIRMELLTPFEDYLSENLSMPESEIIKVGKDMCKALEACRRLNIIHRDVKPQNIFISKTAIISLEISALRDSRRRRAQPRYGSEHIPTWRRKSITAENTDSARISTHWAWSFIGC